MKTSVIVMQFLVYVVDRSNGKFLPKFNLND